VIETPIADDARGGTTAAVGPTRGCVPIIVREVLVVIDPTMPRSRRSVIAAALGGAGAMLAASLGRAAPIAAADNDPLLLGKGTTATDNAATSSTIVNTAASPGFGALTSASATALNGSSDTGIGVFGVSNAPSGSTPAHSTGVVGVTGGGSALDPNVNTDSVGVYGFSDDSISSAGVWGDTLQGIGVVGTGDWGMLGVGTVGTIGEATDSSGTGIFGFSGDDAQLPFPVPSAGVVGFAGTGASTGVRGHAMTGSTYGVVASAVNTTSQYALYVSGRLKLSRSGRVAVGSSATFVSVTMAGVTTSSYIVATLQTNVSACYVRAVVPSTGKFTIYLSKAPGKTAYIGYVVVN
jgi:hypothetical protein